MGNAYQRQARREIDAAYRPAQRQITRQEKRVKAMDRKQQRDEVAYQNWLRDTNASLNAEAATRDSQLRGVEQQYDTALKNDLGAADAASGARAAGIGGSPVVPAGAVDPTNPAYAPQAQRTPILDSVARAQSAAFGGRLASSQRRGLDLSVSTEKNAYASVARDRAVRRAATMESLSKIAEMRGDLAMKKAADQAQRVAELEAAAAEAAQQDFENNLALTKLDQDQFNADRQYDLDANRPAEERALARLHGRIDARKERIGLKNSKGAGGGRPPYTAAQREAGRSAFDRQTALAQRRVQRARRKGEGSNDPVSDLTNWLTKNQRNAAQGNRLSGDVLRIAAKRALGRKLSKRDYDTVRRAGIRVA